jgi:hypothetical protein
MKHQMQQFIYHIVFSIYCSKSTYICLLPVDSHHIFHVLNLLKVTNRLHTVNAEYNASQLTFCNTFKSVFM